LPDQSNLIEVRESPSKGLGIFAKFNIPRGTRVISEPALLEVRREGNSNAKDIVQTFEELTSSQQELFLQLHGYACDSFKCAAEREMEQAWQDISELHRKVLSIYAANAFGNIYLLGSRINHSCLPNVNFAYNSKLKEETFHTIRNIMVGEELTIMYINGTNRTKDQRKTELKKWGFVCSCSTCEDTPRGKQREKMRVQLFSLDQELAMDAKFGTNKSYRKALQTAQRMAAIQKSEGLVHRELGVSYVVISNCLAAVLTNLQLPRCCHVLPEIGKPKNGTVVGRERAGSRPVLHWGGPSRLCERARYRGTVASGRREFRAH
jgi:hypothetical protein